MRRFGGILKFLARKGAEFVTMSDVGEGYREW